METNKDEVAENYDAFVQQLPEFLKSQNGKFALLHNAKVIEFYDTPADAFKVGLKQYGEGSFSIQEVTDDVAIDLGYFAYAIDSSPV